MTRTDWNVLLFVGASAVLSAMAVSRMFGDAVAQMGVPKKDLSAYRLSCFGILLSAIVLATWWFKGGRP